MNIKRILCFTLAFVTLVAVFSFPVSAAYYNGYTTVASAPDVNGCTSMQGMTMGSSNGFCAKISTDNKKAVIYKINKSTGKRTLFTDKDTGKSYCTYLGHANDMCHTTINDHTNLFVVTMKTGSSALVRLKLSGTTYDDVGHLAVKYNGNDLCPSGVVITKKTSDTITFLFKKGRSFYEASMNINKKSGTLNVTKKFAINLTKAVVNGKTVDLSDWTPQGFGYYKNYIYVPMTEGNKSVVLVYNIKDASGTIKTCSDLSFRITSSTYANLFEIESCCISSSDGKLYFTTNRRKVANGTGYDGLHCFKNYSAK